MTRGLPTTVRTIRCPLRHRVFSRLVTTLSCRLLSLSSARSSLHCALACCEDDVDHSLLTGRLERAMQLVVGSQSKVYKKVNSSERVVYSLEQCQSRDNGQNDKGQRAFTYTHSATYAHLSQKLQNCVHSRSHTDCSRKK